MADFGLAEVLVVGGWLFSLGWGYLVVAKQARDKWVQWALSDAANPVLARIGKAAAVPFPEERIRALVKEETAAALKTLPALPSEKTFRDLVAEETSKAMKVVDERLNAGLSIDLEDLGTRLGAKLHERMKELEGAARARAGMALKQFAKEQGMDPQQLEKALEDGDPRAYIAAAFQDLATWEPGKGFDKENPAMAFAFRIGKPFALNFLGNMLGAGGSPGVPRLGPGAVRDGLVKSPFGR